MIRGTFTCGLLFTVTALVALHRASADDKKGQPSDEGFSSIFDGKSLTGWHISAKTGHSRKSVNKTGELRARITGNPPTITTWIKGVKFMEFTDKQKRHPDKGGIGLQVHGGGDYTKQFVRYRNLRIKVLDEKASR